MDSRLELGWASGVAQDWAIARDGLAGRAGQAGQGPVPDPREGLGGDARWVERPRVRAAQAWRSHGRPEGSERPPGVPPLSHPSDRRCPREGSEAQVHSPPPEADPHPQF